MSPELEAEIRTMVEWYQERDQVKALLSEVDTLRAENERLAQIAEERRNRAKDAERENERLKLELNDALAAASIRAGEHRKAMDLVGVLADRINVARKALDSITTCYKMSGPSTTPLAQTLREMAGFAAIALADIGEGD